MLHISLAMINVWCLKSLVSNCIIIRRNH